MLNTKVIAYDGENIQIDKVSGPETLKAGALIWTAGVHGNSINGIDPQSIVSGNRIKVNEFNRVVGLENVFAIGDIAAMITDKYPKGHPKVQWPQ